MIIPTGGVTTEWMEYDTSLTCTGMISDMARQCHDAPAVEDDGEHSNGVPTVLSYGELMDKANRLARVLEVAGAQIGDKVAVMPHRCAAMIVAVIGIQKAGCAFVVSSIAAALCALHNSAARQTRIPAADNSDCWIVLQAMDPKHPRERIAMVLEDCGAKMIVSMEGILEDADQRPDEYEACILLDPTGEVVMSSFQGVSASSLGRSSLGESFTPRDHSPIHHVDPLSGMGSSMGMRSIPNPNRNSHSGSDPFFGGLDRVDLYRAWDKGRHTGHHTRCL